MSVPCGWHMAWAVVFSGADWDTGIVVFIADDLGAWLVGLVADAGRRRVTDWVLGSEQERALRQAVTAALQGTAAELRPGSSEAAEYLAMAISEVFGEPVLGALPAGHTMLEMLQIGVGRQLAVLDDPDLTGVKRSAAHLLDVPVRLLAAVLVGRLAQEIMVRGARGGPLAPLSAQLNHDLTHQQGRRLEDMLGRLIGEVQESIGRPGDRDYRDRTPHLDARVATHRAVPLNKCGVPRYLLEVRLLGPDDIDELDVYLEDGRWLAFSADQPGVMEPFPAGYGNGDTSPEATLIALHAIYGKPLRVGGQPATWRVQLANLPLAGGGQVPRLRVECRAAGETWKVAVPVRDAEIILDHPVIRMVLGPSWPGRRPIRRSDISEGADGEPD
jgi:hypothetical protein